jgi:hypothetical protein
MNLSEAIEQEIDNEYGADQDIFLLEDVAVISEELFNNNVISWRFIPIYTEFAAIAEIDSESGHYFNKVLDDETEMSREDFIDFIIKIEEKYQSLSKVN